MTIDENNKVNGNEVPEGKEAPTTKVNTQNDQAKDDTLKTSTETNSTATVSSSPNNNNTDHIENRKEEETLLKTVLNETATAEPETSEEPEKKNGKNTKSNRKSSSSPNKRSKSSSPTKSNTASQEKDDLNQTEASSNTIKEEDENKVDSDSTQPAEVDTPLFEQPIVLEGKRRRTATIRLEMNELTPKKEIQIPKGNGKPLGEIEYINHQITNTNGEQLVSLQYICFGRKVVHANMKKILRTFAGFDFKKGTPEYDRTLSRLLKYKKPQLKVILDVLGLQQSGRNEEQAERILDFLVEPYDEGKRVAKKMSKQSSASKKRRSTDSSLKVASRKRNNTATSQIMDESDADSNEKDNHTEDDDGGDEMEEEKSDTYEPGRGKKKSLPKKKASSSRGANTVPKDKGQKRKRGSPSPAKKDLKKIKSEPIEVDEKKVARISKNDDKLTRVLERSVLIDIKQENDTADEAKGPSEDSLRSTIKKILNGVDLSGVTMKNVLKDVYSQYPEFNLTERKDFIKNIVKEMGYSEEVEQLCDSKNDLQNLLSPICQCPICFHDIFDEKEVYRVKMCNCMFCRVCVIQYCTNQLETNLVPISCPGAKCNGLFLITELEQVLSVKQIQLYEKLILNNGKYINNLTYYFENFSFLLGFLLFAEVALDPKRLFCPVINCGQICTIPDDIDITTEAPITCTQCKFTFCIKCHEIWHQGLPCLDGGIPFESDPEASIKRCPRCQLPIERLVGCAQMLCRRCKHIFCWYCLKSLDNDFFLLHYERGSCRNRLGHTRISLFLHRITIVGIFAGLSVLLLIATPFLILAAPCIMCCRCKEAKNPLTNYKNWRKRFRTGNDSYTLDELTTLEIEQPMSISKPEIVTLTPQIHININSDHLQI
ncbi:unnamed protein product [Didymodactylos carnosus]|uniref:RBR-type E3 ubiquitin transferase n=1 Tax=Didymodactylos carnosus TaxID=1234261 RepID=A0A813PA46_9BILA|nr:unnamed protein product [Didymodactylos carnosus]CAF0752124.1 unnamed protein product [Didymodactylos carnosus]CAF3495156.1 unnamed protein product [Didymodactylos carnosus]CAF3531892.1 unnamed protein product [Didymodactylos carnosus]